MKKTSVILLCALLCALLSGCAALPRTAVEPTMTSFVYDAAAVEAVEINWASGDVTVAEAAGPQLTVIEKATAQAADQRMQCRIEGKTLHISFCKAGFRGSINGIKQLTVEVPAGIALTVNVTSGSAQVGDLTAARLALGATSGSVAAGALRVGELEAECTAGSVQIASAHADSVLLAGTSGSLTTGPLDVKGALTAASTSGDIALEAVKAQTLQVSATSGNINLGLYQCGQAEAEATSGNITLRVLDGRGAVVEFSSASGSINGKSAREVSRLQIGGGACPVRVRTASGDLTVGEE